MFNCQGAGWCKDVKRNVIHDENPGFVTGFVKAKDVDYLFNVTDAKWTGDTILYSHVGGTFLGFTRYHMSLKISLGIVFRVKILFCH